MRTIAAVILVSAAALLPRTGHAQTLSGTLVVAVADEQGGAIPGAAIRLVSAGLLGGPVVRTADHEGRVRIPNLPMGSYVLHVESAGFARFQQSGITLPIGGTLELRVRLAVAPLEEAVIVSAGGSRIDTGQPGFATRIGGGDVERIPSRRASMFDIIRAAPGVSPTSPSSGGATTVSIFGSGTNENSFLLDGTNFTCPCSGIARAEPVVDFITAVELQSAGASAEFGNALGGVINVVTRSGTDRLNADAAYFAQAAALTSGPVSAATSPGAVPTAYERIRYSDAVVSAGGPALPGRVWFFGGYQYLRDSDSQPGTDPTLPRRYQQDTFLGKVTWRIASAWQLVHSTQIEYWVNPGRPTQAMPFETTTRANGRVPASTFGHLTHTLSPSTVWEVRVGRFVHAQQNPPATGDLTVPNRRDRNSGISSGAPPAFGDLTVERTTAKATMTHDLGLRMHARHEVKLGAQVERGAHDSSVVTPTGVRYVDNNGAPFQAIFRDPGVGGGRFTALAAFVSDTMRSGDRLTISAGVRFDRVRADSQDLEAVDLLGQRTGTTVTGLGHLYTWNLVSPRLGVVLALDEDARARLRGTYGRFTQGVLTGEFEPFHPGRTPTTTAAFDPATGGYTRIVSVVDPISNLVLDRSTRAPRTDEYSVSFDRQLPWGLAVTTAYVRKRGTQFIGWTDTGGQYAREDRLAQNGTIIPVFRLVNSTADRRFLLTNADGYATAYDGLVLAVERGRSAAWRIFGSYTFSKASGLIASSGSAPSSPQVTTTGPPNALVFGQDPNDLTNARGRLANDRPHVFRVMGTVEVPRTPVRLAANLQHFSGKPWAASTQVLLPQGDQRILIEPRGTRRLPSQTLLDLRVSGTVHATRQLRIELLLDVLNALNDTAHEGIVTDNFASASFGAPTTYVDPRRAMLGARINFGR